MGKYRVMVADDEMWIRETIKKLVKDTGMEFDTVCEARNGKEAMELIGIFHPDIVITDIRMPGIDGIGVMDYIKQNCKYIKFIIISGFSDYEYMKKAVSCGACDYLLKPISFNDLKEALMLAATGIENDRNNLFTHAELVKSMELKREMFFLDIINARIKDSADIEEEANLLGISNTDEKKYLCLMRFREIREISGKKFSGNIGLLIFSIKNIFLEVTNEYNIKYTFCTDDRSGLLVIFSQKQTDFRNEAESIFNKVNLYLYCYLGIHTIEGISGEFAGYNALCRAYLQAKEALLQNTISDTSAIRIYQAQSENADVLYPKQIECIRKLIQAVNAGNRKEVKMIFGQMAGNILSNDLVSLDEIRRICSECITTLEALLKAKCPEWVERPELQNPDGIFSKRQVETFLSQWEELVLTHLENAGGLSNTDVMKAVGAYLREHYFDELSLVDIAGKYHFEPTYFSKLFRNSMKKSFIEYIISIRMEKACELLKSTCMKVQDISIFVGYDDQRYFSQIFRKYTGLTPSVYRERCEDSYEKMP